MVIYMYIYIQFISLNVKVLLVFTSFTIEDFTCAHFLKKCFCCDFETGSYTDQDDLYVLVYLRMTLKS